MFETPMTVVGRIVTDLRRRVVAGQGGDQLPGGQQLAPPDRRGAWEPGNSLYITVNCWGKLVTGVGAALYKGAPVIVSGVVHTSEYEDKDGIKRSSLEMRANGRPRPGPGDRADRAAGPAEGHRGRRAPSRTSPRNPRRPDPTAWRCRPDSGGGHAGRRLTACGGGTGVAAT